MWQTPAFREFNTKLATILGAKTAKEFEALRVFTIGDLIRHVPRRYFSTSENSDLAHLRVGEEVAVMARVASAQIKPYARGLRLEAVITDGRGTLHLAFFGRRPLVEYWHRQLTPGNRGIFAGKVGVFLDNRQLTHPDFVILADDGRIVGGAERNAVLATAAVGSAMVGIYPATKKLPTWRIADCVRLVLDHLGEIPDPWPGWLLDRADVVGLAEAMHAVHRPQDWPSIERGMRRLLFDEAFGVQAAMAYRRLAASRQPAVARRRTPEGLLAAFDAGLPFELTRGQTRVGEEIFADLGRDHPMQRLLQGEVGSGKTLVSLRAMLCVVDSGAQAALLAPTEVLAQQHYHTISAQLGSLGHGGTLAAADHATGVRLLVGSMSAAQKKAALFDIASGAAGIVIGTHALLADRVQFADLGMVVVDEQHRFGVEQRAALDAKAATRPHLLAMTATPIPRTVAMTVFGDLEVSTLSEIPAGRSTVSTTVVDERERPAWVERAWRRIVEEVAAGRQAFVVCSRISAKDRSAESLPAPEGEEQIEARTVEDLYAELAAGPLRELRVEMVHGQLPGEQKESVMSRFARGEVDVIVSTTVVEVGVDVPNASVMVICDADRFGISQLHQLRGRIGRGAHPGVCLLLTKVARDTPAAGRLAAVAATRDGFELAEADLQQRREGDVLGAAQAGSRSGLRLLQVLEHVDLIEMGRALATDAIIDDPDLGEPGVADAVAQIEEQAAAEWMERT